MTNILKYLFYLILGFATTYVVGIIFSPNKHLWGNHVVVRHNDTIYSGNFLLGFFHGEGTYFTSNGRYEGQWYFGKKNGYGKYTHEDGSEFRGEWKDGERNGVGVWSGSDGTRKELVYYKGDLISSNVLTAPKKQPQKTKIKEKNSTPKQIDHNRSTTSDNTTRNDNTTPNGGRSQLTYSQPSSPVTSSPVYVPQPVPVQVTDYCGVCGHSGNCSNCGGSGISLRNGSGHPCGACGHSGRCATCNGTGISGYHIEYRYY